jgi:hypothetical protein
VQDGAVIKTVKDMVAKKYKTVEDIKGEIQALTAESAHVMKPWERRHKESQEKLEELDAEERDEDTPHIVNLSEDPNIDRKVKYFFSAEESITVGRRTQAAKHHI